MAFKISNLVFVKNTRVNSKLTDNNFFPSIKNKTKHEFINNPKIFIKEINKNILLKNIWLCEGLDFLKNRFNNRRNPLKYNIIEAKKELDLCQKNEYYYINYLSGRRIKSKITNDYIQIILPRYDPLYNKILKIINDLEK
jgi:hypothetical protein